MNKEITEGEYSIIEDDAIRYANSQKPEEWGAAKLGYMAGFLDCLDKSPIDRLIQFAFEQTRKGNHFFFDFSGHVNDFSIWGYIGEWHQFKDVINRFSCKTSEIDINKAESWIKKFENELS